MRARRKKGYQARREARAARFWQKEVAPVIARHQREAFELGRRQGKREAEQAVTLNVPDLPDRIDLDVLTQRHVGDYFYINIERPPGGRPLGNIPLGNIERSPWGRSGSRVEKIGFVRMAYGLEVDGRYIRWTIWQPADERLRGEAAYAPLQVVGGALTILQEIASFTTDYGARSRAETFLGWAKSRGVNPAPFPPPAPEYPRAEDEWLMRLAAPGAWR